MQTLRDWMKNPVPLSDDPETWPKAPWYREEAPLRSRVVADQDELAMNRFVDKYGSLSDENLQRVGVLLREGYLYSPFYMQRAKEHPQSEKKYWEHLAGGCPKIF